MPWIDKNKCIGCGVCIKECPVNAISVKKEKAEINMEKCISCGKCHEVCPQEAIRHNSEKILLEVRENLDKVNKLMKNFKTKEEKRDFLERMIRWHNKEKMVAEKTIEGINNIGAIRSLKKKNKN